MLFGKIGQNLEWVKNLEIIFEVSFFFFAPSEPRQQF